MTAEISMRREGFDPAKIEPFSRAELIRIKVDSYHTAIEALQRAERRAKATGLKRADFAMRAGLDRATVSRILNGSTRNITLKTLFLLLRAMGERTFIDSKPLAELAVAKPNHRFTPVPPSNAKVFVTVNTPTRSPVTTFGSGSTQVSTGSSTTQVMAVQR